MRAKAITSVRELQNRCSAPRAGVLNARILLNDAGETDTTCQLMGPSPHAAAGLHGPSLIGYTAGMCVFRTSLYRQIGVYEPRLFIGGEEYLVALDVLASGFASVYANEHVLHHHPSRIRDSGLRRRMLARNAARVAWMRLPWSETWNATRVAIKIIRREGAFPRDALALIAALPWAQARHCAIPDDVARVRKAVHLANRI